MIVADTDVLIDFLTGYDPGASSVMKCLEQGDLWITAISRFELLCGAGSKKQERIIRQLLRALPTLPLDESSADTAATVRKELTAGGSDIGMADSLIAGIVLEHDATFLTRNVKHFKKVAGLQLV